MRALWAGFYCDYGVKEASIPCFYVLQDPV